MLVLHVNNPLLFLMLWLAMSKLRMNQLNLIFDKLILLTFRNCLIWKPFFLSAFTPWDQFIIFDELHFTMSLGIGIQKCLASYLITKSIKRTFGANESFWTKQQSCIILTVSLRKWCPFLFLYVLVDVILLRMDFLKRTPREFNFFLPPFLPIKL